VNTIVKSLGVEASQITKDLFFRFIHSIAQKGNTSAQQYRSALLLYQRQNRLTTWAADKDVLVVCKGGVRIGEKVCPKIAKGCMSGGMLDALLVLRITAVPEVQLCKYCKVWFSSRDQLLAATKKWLRLQFFGKLRPGEVEMLLKTSLITTTEWLGSTRVELSSFVFETGKKNGEAGEKFPQDSQILSVFADACGISPVTQKYVAPRCCDVHIGHLVGAAARELNWSTSVVWTAHAVKHSALTALNAGILSACTEFTAGVTRGTFSNVYTKH
jgi:hypothetical protein